MVGQLWHREPTMCTSPIIIHRSVGSGAEVNIYRRSIYRAGRAQIPGVHLAFIHRYRVAWCCGQQNQPGLSQTTCARRQCTRANFLPVPRIWRGRVLRYTRCLVYPISIDSRLNALIASSSSFFFLFRFRREILFIREFYSIR